MKQKIACLSLGLACLMGAAIPASAGDFGSDAGGMKDGIYDGVPVPAPQPIPLYEAQWYVRADLGYSFSATGRVSEELSPPTMAPSTLYQIDDINGPVSIGFGGGRYITPSLRVELAVDLRNDTKVATSGSAIVGTIITDGGIRTDGGGNSVQTYDTHYYTVNREDKTRIGNYTGMVNLYYDFKNGSRFTPYFGVGGGVVLHTMKRKYTEISECYASTNTLDGVYPGCIAGVGNDAQTRYEHKGGKVANSWGLAAALMAGVSYELGDGYLLDTSYRYMWQGASTTVVANTLNGTSKVRVGERTDHEVRVGIRMNIN